MTIHPVETQCCALLEYLQGHDSIPIDDLPQDMRENQEMRDAFEVCKHRGLIYLSRTAKDSPNWSPETAGWRLNLSLKGSAYLAELHLASEDDAGDERPDQPPPVARALGILVDFPSIESVRAVAARAECHYSTLYKSEKFMDAWERTRGTPPPPGIKDARGNIDASPGYKRRRRRC